MRPMPKDPGKRKRRGHDVTARGEAKSSPDELLGNMLDRDMLAIAEREGQGAISLERLREIPSSIPGSMSDVVISERGDS